MQRSCDEAFWEFQEGERGWIGDKRAREKHGGYLPLKTLAALPKGLHSLGGLEMETRRSEAWSEEPQTVDKPRQSQGGQQEALGRTSWS